MTWMGQSAYPSMVWQTYDYYYDLTGAYWGTKSACEPLHILWNPVTDAVKVANTTAENYQDLKAEVTVYNMDGKAVPAYSKSSVVHSASNSTLECFTIDFNKERPNLGLNQKVVVSSTSEGDPSMAVDGKKDTRWSSAYRDNEWIYVDLGKVQPVGGVRLDWEASYGKEYKIQVSNDAQQWEEAYSTKNGIGGVELITFPKRMHVMYVCSGSREAGGTDILCGASMCWEEPVRAKV